MPIDPFAPHQVRKGESLAYPKAKQAKKIAKIRKQLVALADKELKFGKAAYGCSKERKKTNKNRKSNGTSRNSSYSSKYGRS
jgi:hypothetical protein